MPQQEIELKLKIKNKSAIKRKLKELGAKFDPKITQTDILFNSEHFDFADADQVLRIRTNKSQGKTTSIFGFKETPRHTKDGHKIRDEFETTADAKVIEEILTRIGFFKAASMTKVRETCHLPGLEISLDKAAFGTFLEIEGPPNKIESLRKQLGLENAKPIPEGYIFLQRRWENSHGRSSA